MPARRHQTLRSLPRRGMSTRRAGDDIKSSAAPSRRIVRAARGSGGVSCARAYNDVTIDIIERRDAAAAGMPTAAAVTSNHRGKHGGGGGNINGGGEKISSRRNRHNEKSAAIAWRGIIKRQRSSIVNKRHRSAYQTSAQRMWRWHASGNGDAAMAAAAKRRRIRKSSAQHQRHRRRGGRRNEK